MQTLEVTDEQYASIQQLREAISTDIVGQYGFVRERDAVQFLIDNLDADALETTIDQTAGATATDDVAAAVDAAVSEDPDSQELEEVRYDESSTDEDEPESESESEPTDDSSEPTTDEDEASDEADPVGEETDDDGPSDESDGASDDGAADDDDMLNRMMSLLETHDDKWEESPSTDYRYRVTLPDGSTKDVQTKDDVRALLFKHY